MDTRDIVETLLEHHTFEEILEYCYISELEALEYLLDEGYLELPPFLVDMLEDEYGSERETQD